MTFELDRIMPLLENAIITMIFLLLIVPVLIHLERKITALIQRRVGPLKMSWPWIDLLKLFFKEDSATFCNKGILFRIAPILSFALVFCPLAGLPMFQSTEEMPIGLFYPQLEIFFTLGSIWLVAFGVLLAGWSSGGNYPILGVIRFCLQTITAELPMLFSIIALILVYNTGNIHTMVMFQNETIFHFLPKWGFFLQPLAAVIFLSCIFIKTGQGPFDLPREKSTLVDGLYTEYSSTRFALLHATQYVHLIVLILFFCTLFLGGHNILPGFDQIEYNFPIFSKPLQIFSLLLKSFLVFIFFIWVKCSLPRYRIDQMITIGRRRLMPLSMINLVVTVYILYFGESL